MIGDEACNACVANIFLHIDVIYTEHCGIKLLVVVIQEVLNPNWAILR